MTLQILETYHHAVMSTIFWQNDHSARWNLLHFLESDSPFAQRHAQEAVDTRLVDWREFRQARHDENTAQLRQF